MPFSFGDDPFHAGESATVQCTVFHGDLPLNISWMFNENPNLPSVTVSVSRVTARVSVLAVDPVLAMNIGNYTCIADNEAGHAEHTTQLLVNGLTFVNGFNVRCFGCGHDCFLLHKCTFVGKLLKLVTNKEVLFLLVDLSPYI